MFTPKNKISIKEAIKTGKIEKYYNRNYKRYFWALCDYVGFDGYDTASEALASYYEIKERQDKLNKAKIEKENPLGECVWCGKETSIDARECKQFQGCKSI